MAILKSVGSLAIRKPIKGVFLVHWIENPGTVYPWCCW